MGPHAPNNIAVEFAKVDSKLSAFAFFDMNALTFFSFVVTILLQSCIIFLLLRRELQKRLFCFLLCSLYWLAVAIIRFATFRHRSLYFDVYWITSLVGFVFVVLALWESFSGIFWLETKQPWFRWVFWSCVSAVVTYAALRAWFSPPRGMTLGAATQVNLEIGRDYLIIAFSMLYFGLLRFFKVIGHQRESTIIWGFGISALMAALGFLIRSVFVTKFTFLSTWLPYFGFIIAELAWTRNLLRKEQDEKVPEPEISLGDLRFAMGYYTQLLYRYLGKETKE